jgi:hypothetical protein
MCVISRASYRAHRASSQRPTRQRCDPPASALHLRAALHVDRTAPPSGDQQAAVAPQSPHEAARMNLQAPGRSGSRRR